MYAIYGNIYHQYTSNVSINLPYIRILWGWMGELVGEPGEIDTLGMAHVFPQIGMSNMNMNRPVVVSTAFYCNYLVLTHAYHIMIGR